MDRTVLGEIKKHLKKIKGLKEFGIPTNKLKYLIKKDSGDNFFIVFNLYLWSLLNAFVKSKDFKPDRLIRKNIIKSISFKPRGRLLIVDSVYGPAAINLIVDQLLKKLAEQKRWKIIKTNKKIERIATGLFSDVNYRKIQVYYNEGIYFLSIKFNKLILKNEFLSVKKRESFYNNLYDLIQPFQRNNFQLKNTDTIDKIGGKTEKKFTAKFTITRLNMEFSILKKEVEQVESKKLEEKLGKEIQKKAMPLLLIFFPQLKDAQ